jgi:hypothetical protein
VAILLLHAIPGSRVLIHRDTKIGAVLGKA